MHDIFHVRCAVLVRNKTEFYFCSSQKKQGRMGDALAQEGDEGRGIRAIRLDKLDTSVMSRGSPNEETPPVYRRMHL